MNHLQRGDTAIGILHEHYKSGGLFENYPPEGYHKVDQEKQVVELVIPNILLHCQVEGEDEHGREK